MLTSIYSLSSRKSVKKLLRKITSTEIRIQISQHSVQASYQFDHRDIRWYYSL